MAPTVIRDGPFAFVVHTRELRFEPPHVHVECGDDEVRIRLDDGTFLEEPPWGRRRALLEAFRRNERAIRDCWHRVHTRHGRPS